MCTAVCAAKDDFYFGRNLDVEFSFNEKVIITPRNRKYVMKNGNTFVSSYGMFGIGAVINDYPFYYEACNEAGLCIAGLNFPKNAVYNDPKEGYFNISPFELPLWLLGSAESVDKAKELLNKVNLTNIAYNPDMPLSPLHFIVSDKSSSVTVEPVKDGLKIYDNPFNVLTNNPPFEYHIWNMQKYLNISPSNEKNKFSREYELNNYAVGMGAFGLPGDASSASRFVRAAFNLTNSDWGKTEENKVSQFFHVLDSAAMVKGATLTEQGKNDITLYSCCINADKQILYYKTYDNSRINAVLIKDERYSSSSLSVFDLDKNQDIRYIE